MDQLIILAGGNVEYSQDGASVSIDELIESLEEAKQAGATRVVMSSGNYRGPKWASVKAGWCWADDDDC